MKLATSNLECILTMEGSSLCMMEYPTDLRALAVSLQQLSYLLGIDVLLTDCFFTLFSDYNIDRSL